MHVPGGFDCLAKIQTPNQAWTVNSVLMCVVSERYKAMIRMAHLEVHLHKFKCVTDRARVTPWYQIASRSTDEAPQMCTHKLGNGSNRSPSQGMIELLLFDCLSSFHSTWKTKHKLGCLV